MGDRGRGRPEAKDGCRIYVGNLQDYVHKDEVIDLFSKDLGKVVDCWYVDF